LSTVGNAAADDEFIIEEFPSLFFVPSLISLVTSVAWISGDLSDRGILLTTGAFTVILCVERFWDSNPDLVEASLGSRTVVLAVPAILPLPLGTICPLTIV